MHPPLRGAPRDQGLLSYVSLGKCQVVLWKTPPKHAVQPPGQGYCSVQTPWASTAQQTQGKQAKRLSGDEQYKGQVRRSHLGRDTSPSHGPAANRILQGIHVLINSGIQLHSPINQPWCLLAHIPREAVKYMEWNYLEESHKELMCKSRGYKPTQETSTSREPNGPNIYSLQQSAVHLFISGMQSRHLTQKA